MQAILDQVAPSYYMNIREFANKTVEAVVTAIRPMQMDTAKKRYEEFWSLGLSAEPKELTEDERQANWNRSVRRARQNIRFLCKQLGADRLFTLTYRENIEDRELVKKNFKEFLRLVRSGIPGVCSGIPGWQYVAVLERQDRGAYHIHCAVKGFQKIKILRACWYKALGSRPDATGADTPGQIDVTSPRARWGATQRQWDTNKLASYISKYMHKTFDENATEKKRYWTAKGLKFPVKHRIWLGAQNVVDMVTEAYGLLESFHGIQPDFGMWLSSDMCNFWIGGRIE